MSNNLIKQNTSLAIDTAKSAGQIVMSYYKKKILINKKTDGSPVTDADIASNDFIVSKLKLSKILIVSEESNDLDKFSNIYWLVDPLDGTKDFIACNDEFTINIALIINEFPVLGVVYAPALDELYVGIKDETYMLKNGVKYLCNNKNKSKNLKMAVSRFHNHIKSETFFNCNNLNESKPIGSALKYGRIAFGEVDVYPRYVGTSEWDTAAGQAVLESSGGKIIDMNSGKRLKYGKFNRRNGSFIAFRSPYSINDFKY